MIRFTSLLYRIALAGVLGWLGVQSASAHLTYAGRDFGTFVGDGSNAPVTLTINNVSGSFGWADATDADFGDSHRARAFRFRLNKRAVVTLNVQGVVVGAAPALPFPAFSIYRGLGHVAPVGADHDASPSTVAYLETLGGVQPKEGALAALGDWKIGNEDVPTVPLSSFTYMGHKADGTPANYGSAFGIDGDGIADGTVVGSFVLPAGDYTIMIGGADYAASIGAIGPFTNHGVTTTLSVAPLEAIVKGGPPTAVPNSTYASLYAAATNGTGTLAFRAKLKVGSTSSYVIARRTISTALVAQSGAPASETTGTWKTFGDPVVNDAGEVAFTASLVPGAGGVLASTDTGVWSDLGGTLKLALREGDLAPGGPVGQLFSKTNWINLQNGTLFLSAATSDGTAKSAGIWKWNGAVLTKILALGDTLTGSDLLPRVVKAFSRPNSTGNGNATSRLAGSDATLALLVTFVDGRVEQMTFE